eukprot:g16041.t1
MRISNIRDRLDNVRKQQTELREFIAATDAQLAEASHERDEKAAQLSGAKQAAKRMTAEQRIRVEEHAEGAKRRQREVGVLAEALEILAGSGAGREEGLLQVGRKPEDAAEPTSTPDRDEERADTMDNVGEDLLAVARGEKRNSETSFLQLQRLVRGRDKEPPVNDPQHTVLIEKALEILKSTAPAGRSSHSRAVFLASKISAEQTPFESIKTLIADMITKLEREAATNASKEKFCVEQLANNKEDLESLAVRKTELSNRLDAQAARLEQLQGKIRKKNLALKKIGVRGEKLTKQRNAEKATLEKEGAEAKSGGEAVARARLVLADFYGTGGDTGGAADAGAEKASPASGSARILSLLESLESDYAKALIEATSAENQSKKLFEADSAALQEEKASLRQELDHFAEKKLTLKAEKTERETEIANLVEEEEAATQQKKDLEAQCETMTPEMAEKKAEEKRAARRGDIESLKMAMDLLKTEP